MQSMEPQLPHMQHYGGPVNPQIQPPAMDPQAMNQQNMIRPIDPQAMGRPMEHQTMQRPTEHQPASRSIDLHPLSRSMDSHPIVSSMESLPISTMESHSLPRPVDSQSMLRPLDPHLMPRSIESQHMMGSYDPKSMERHMEQHSLPTPMHHKHMESHINPGIMQGSMDPKHIDRHPADTCNMPGTVDIHMGQQHMGRALEPVHMPSNQMVQQNHEIIRMDQQFQDHVEKEIAEIQAHAVQLVTEVIVQDVVEPRSAGKVENSAADQHIQHSVPCHVLSDPANVVAQQTESVTQPAINRETTNGTVEKLSKGMDDDSSSMTQEVVKKHHEDTKVGDVKMYRMEMKSLCEKLSLAGEESVVLTADLSEGKVNKFGSKLGMMFLSGNSGMLDGFLTFCRDQFNAEVTVIPPTSDKKKRGRKKKGEEEQHIETDSVIENVSPKPTKEKVKQGRQRKSARIETVQTKQELPSSAPAEEDDEDDNNIDLDDPADSDVACDGGVVEVDDIKIESTEDEPRVTRSRKKKLSVVANKQKKKLVKSKRKGQLSVQVSKLKMKISSEKKKGKEAKGRNWKWENQSVEDDKTATSPLTTQESPCQSEDQNEEDEDVEEIPAPTEQKYKCEYCKKKFESTDELVKHTERTHERKMAYKGKGKQGGFKFTCKDCKFSFKTRMALKRHRVKCLALEADDESTSQDAIDIFKRSSKHFPVKPFKCNKCKRFFKTSEGRRIHSLNCTGTDMDEMSLTCKICSGTYANKSALIKHEQAHEKDLGRLERLESLIDFSTITPSDSLETETEVTNDVVETQNVNQIVESDKPKDNSENWKVVHKCDECDRKFGTIRDLRNHQSGHRKGKVTYDCDQCSKVYINKIALYRHQQVHSKSGLYTCKVCNRDYSSLDNLIKHGKVHQGDPPFKCDICNKGFYEKRYLQWHINAHLKIKPYMCDQCGKAFPRPGQLREHRRVHSDERPYKCDICGKCFKLYDTMRNHKDTHNTLQNFVCHTCGRRFNRAYNLRKHQKIHSEVATYICDECGKGFKNSTALKSHFIAFHLKPEDVKNCKYTVHQCEFCLKPFAEKVDRDCHMRTHTGEKPFSCEICGKTFANKSNMRSHVRNHQGEKSKLCNICGKGFSFNRDLKKHMLSHNRTNDDQEKQKALKKQTPAAVRPQSTWTDCQHAPPPPPAPPTARQYHHDNVSPRHQDQLQQTVMEASAEALSAAYALTMAREATMQQMGNPGSSSEFSWQFL